MESLVDLRLPEREFLAVVLHPQRRRFRRLSVAQFRRAGHESRRQGLLHPLRSALARIEIVREPLPGLRSKRSAPRTDASSAAPAFPSSTFAMPLPLWYCISIACIAAGAFTLFRPQSVSHSQEDAETSPSEAVRQVRFGG